MNDRIQEIKRRLEAATPGTWEVVVRGNREIAIYSKDELVMSFGGDIGYETFKGNPPGDADENLITWANSDITYLLSEVERLQEGYEVLAQTPMTTHPSETRDFAKRMLKGETPYR